MCIRDSNKRVTKVTGKEDDMRTNYMMTVDDVMEELGVKRSKAYSILKQLNDEPVSYTHLSVRLPAKRKTSRAQMKSDSSFWIWASCWRIPAVSYTHLDVYKRQL